MKAMVSESSRYNKATMIYGASPGGTFVFIFDIYHGSIILSGGGGIFTSFSLGGSGGDTIFVYIV
jgi:hypothetical protein